MLVEVPFNQFFPLFFTFCLQIRKKKSTFFGRGGPGRLGPPPKSAPVMCYICYIPKKKIMLIGLQIIDILGIYVN